MWPLRMHVYHHIWVVYGVALTAGCIGSCRRVAGKCWCSQTGQVRSDSCRSTWARSSCWSDHNCNTHIMTHIPHYYSSPIIHLYKFLSSLRTDTEDCLKHEGDLRATTDCQLCQSYVLGTGFLCGVKHLVVPVYPAGQQSVEARQVELQHAAVERDVCCRWIRMVLLSSEVQIKVCEENVQQLQQSVMEHDYSWNTHTYTYNACKSLKKLHCSHTSNSL